jgi:large subunit ribosomal protein L7Ae
MVSIYEIVETASKTGKIDRGINEVTKAIERATAKLVVVAKDVDPKEITQHIPILCKEKEIQFEEADSKEKLGISSGINRPASAIAIIEAGEANIAALAKKQEKKEETQEAKPEQEAKEEPKPEEKPAETPQEQPKEKE